MATFHFRKLMVIFFFYIMIYLSFKHTRAHILRWCGNICKPWCRLTGRWRSLVTTCKRFCIYIVYFMMDVAFVVKCLILIIELLLLLLWFYIIKGLTRNVTKWFLLLGDIGKLILWISTPKGVLCNGLVLIFDMGYSLQLLTN